MSINTFHSQIPIKQTFKQYDDLDDDWRSTNIRNIKIITFEKKNYLQIQTLCLLSWSNSNTVRD